MGDKLLSVKELEERIAKLSDIDNNSSSFKVHEQFVVENRKIFTSDEIMPYPRFQFNQINFSDIKFYRVTSFKNFQQSNISHYSYPPCGFTARGRCNLPKFPVFYCSEYGATSIIEFLRAHPDQISDDLYLSEWIMTRSYQWKMLAFVLSGLPEVNAGNLIANQLRSKAEKTLLEFMPEHEIQKYIKFYHEAFTSNEHKFSSITSHSFLQIDNQDVILYPSIANDKKDLNQAINANLIDNELLKLDKVFTIKVKVGNISELNDDMFYDLTSVANRKSDSLIWRLPTHRDKLNCYNAISPYEI
jgi:hypothetical protein